MNGIQQYSIIFIALLFGALLPAQQSPYLFEVKEAFIPYRAGSQWGYCNAQKELLIAPQYEAADFFQEGFAIVKQAGEYSLIDETGARASERGYARIRYRPGRGYELFDTADGPGYPAQISEGRLLPQQEERAAAPGAAPPPPPPPTAELVSQAGIYKEGGKYGFRSGYAIADPGGGAAQYDWDHLIPPIYDSIAALGPNQLAVLQNGKWGIVGPDDDVLLEIDYDHLTWIAYWGNRAYLVSRAGRWGIISRAFEPLIPVEYDTLAIAGQLILAAKEGRWGVLDFYGQPVLPLRYEALAHNSYNRENYFFVQKDGRWGVLRGAGKTVLDFQYANIKPTAGPYFMVHDGQGWGVVDEKGEVVLPGAYHDIALDYVYGQPDKPGFRLFRDGRVGFFSPAFNKHFEPHYLDFHAFLPNNLARVETADGPGYISWEGVEYFE
jgi:hypothetical protein